MINKNEKYLKNYLNYELLKKSLKIQQNKLMLSYNIESNINIHNNSSFKLKLEDNNYINNSRNLNDDNIININLENNEIFKIRLEQTKEALIELSKKKWPNINICQNILELKGNVIL